ncbi:MAG TPA: flagellar filament capping protein FliD [Methylotenera sp.]|nr:flagellar filament capping protein FliD [Methylotenera sp.]HPH04986.1 flagellar filament capping protein FliD [Methylotenera sp.]HPN00248.1 flagellar filament capping protein FliD [Methylotenera sp.]
MAITSAGIGSGLDVSGIVSSLMSVERQPLNALTKQKTAYETKVSAYGSMKSALSTFQTAISSLSDATKFNAQAVTSGDTKVFTATANGQATNGSYSVTVNQLAKAQKLVMAGTANTTDVVGTGTLTISFGKFTEATTTPVAAASFTPNTAKTDITIDINSANNTLSGVRDAINASNSSVSAAIVNDGTTNRLVITSKDTGEVNSLKISVADADGNSQDATGLSQLAYDPLAVSGAGKNLTQLQAAKNALFEVDGIAISKASNVITDAIEGVTLNLLSVNTGSTLSLDVATDKEKIKESVKSFVDAFNKLDDTLRNLTKYDSTGKSSGVLLGDATARSVMTQVKAVMTKSLESTNSVNTLTQVGISFLNTGKLALDEAKLSKVLDTNFNDLAALFTASAKTSDALVSYSGSTSKTLSGTYAVNVSQLGSSTVDAAGTINGVAATGNKLSLTGATGDASDGLSIKVLGGALGDRGTVTFTRGYASQLDGLISTLLKSDGVLAAKTDGFKSSITRLDKQADALNLRLTAIEARYRAQYTRLDTVISSMQSTSTFLTQQIAAINANNNSN